MTRKPAIYSVIGALIAAFVLDVGIFLAQVADALSPAPAAFNAEDYSGDGFKVAHYQLDRTQFAVEFAAIFVVITIIRMLRGRRTQR